MNTGVQVSLSRFNLESFREIPRNAMTGLYSTEFCVSFFFFLLRMPCIDFHCGRFIFPGTVKGSSFPAASQGLAATCPLDDSHSD